MNVYSRPLFRQAGGPAQPMPSDMGAPMMPPSAPPMPQGGAPMPPEMAMLQEAEVGSRAQGEQLGAEYAQNMMAGLDAAETPEDVINAMRGNVRPMEERRQELAGFVGSDDANQTPESVLALVQPVIMMTEQGAIDSGIGELIRGMVGDIEMATAEGQPTEMGQGLGSLMSMGAQEAPPPPQNFSQGGAVRHFDKGGEATKGMEEAAAPPPPSSWSSLISSIGGMDDVTTYYDKLVPLYNRVLGPSEEDKADLAEQQKFNKAQASLALAQAGLSLASGIDPTTGQNMAGRPFVSQLASAAQPLPAQLSKLAAADREQQRERRTLERGLRTAALDTAIKQGLTGEKALQDIGLAAATAANKPGTTKLTPYYLGDDVRAIDENAPGAQAQIQRLLDLGYRKGEGPDKSKSDKAIARARLNNMEGVRNLTRALLQDSTDEAALTAVSDLALLMEPDTRTGATGPLPPILKPFATYILDPTTLNEAKSKYATQVDEETQKIDEMIERIRSGSSQPRELSDFIDRRIGKLSTVSMEEGVGLPSALFSALEYMTQQVGDIFGADISRSKITDSAEARRLLSSALQSVDQYVSSAPEKDRMLAAQYERLVENMPRPSAFQTDRDAKELLSNFLAILEADIDRYQTRLDNGELYKSGDVTQARDRITYGTQISNLLSAMVRNFESGPSGANAISESPSGTQAPPNLSTYYNTPR